MEGTGGQRHRGFYGWWIVAAVAAGLFVGYVPIIGFTFSIFFVPIAEELKWSRAEISLAFSLSLLALSACLPITGRLVDRIGARRVILPSAVLFGLSLASLYFLSANLWHYYAVFIALGVVGSGATPIPYYKVIANWFDTRRGLALGLSMIGVGLSEFITPSAAQALISVAGWRVTYVVIGFVVVTVTLPVAGLFLEERPEQMGLQPDGKTAGQGASREASGRQQGMTVGQACRAGTFWLMSSGLFLVAMSLTGCLVHLAPLLKDRGAPATTAALAVSVLGGANMLGRLLAGYILDRVFAPYVALCFFCGATAGILILLSGTTGGLAFLAAFMIGFGMGAEGDIMPYLVARYFGLRAFGEVYGYVLSVFTLGAMLGPVILGLTFDAYGDYRIALTGFVAATLLGAALITQLGPYRKWEATDVKGEPTAEAGDTRIRA